ncbi:MAG: 50S ribosomal protein L3 [Candidatus Altiarchaeota archaeon]
MGTIHKPRSGSLAYLPRKRAKKETPRIHHWPTAEDGEVKPQGFAGYKAGMTHLMAVDNTKNSVTKGLEVMIPVTVVEVHPMRIAAIRIYKEGYFGKKTKKDIYAEMPEELGSRLTKPKKEKKPDIEKALKELGEISDIRLLAHTQPSKNSTPKKKPDIMEVALSGPKEKKLEYAKSILGNEITISDIFEPNQYVDITSVTKGKGFQGAIKRMGIKKQPRKSTKRTRHIGTGGAWTPTKKLWTEPQAGQMGYHTRTEFNKVIVSIGSEGEKITPAGGFLRYGPVKGSYVVLKGSIPGPTKRIIRFTPARRPPKKEPSYEITEINLRSKQ